jgi:hypothetical protein
MRYVQELLGYESSKTTETYTHITKKGWENLKKSTRHLGHMNCIFYICITVYMAFWVSYKIKRHTKLKIEATFTQL